MFNVTKFIVHNQILGGPVPLYLGYSLNDSNFTSRGIRPANSYYIFKYTLSGCGNIIDSQSGETWELPTGTAMLIKFPSERFIFSTHKDCDDWEGIYIEFEAGEMEGLLSSLISDLGVKYHISPDSALIKKMLSWHKQYFNGGAIVIEALERTKLICQIIAELNEYKDNHQTLYESLIRGACTYINDNINASLTINEIADFLSVSRSHLSRIFKQRLNICLHDYIISAKIKYVCQLLIKNEMSNDEIAYYCGYASSIQFYRQFKRITGMTPGEFRKAVNQEEIIRSL